MKTIGSKVAIIVLIVIALLAIGGGVFAYVYFATDTFRTGQELFAKYLTQNLEEFSKISSLNKLEEVEEKLKQNKYEETITISYSEEGTEPNGTATIETQNDPINQKTYGIISLATQNPDETLKVEYMKEAEVYALRFTNAVKQFLSIENSNLKQFASNMGMDEEEIELIPYKIDFEKISLEEIKFTDEEKKSEIKKYTELLYNNIPTEKYTKSKNTVITVNGKTINTNAYILTLNVQEVKNLALKLLETAKQDEILLAKFQTIDEVIKEYTEESFKDMMVETIQETINELTSKQVSEEEKIILTVYEQNGETIRFKAEHELEYVTLDTTEVDGKNQMDINFVSMSEDNTQLSYGIKFIKENDKKLNVQFGTIVGEEQHTYQVTTELIENENNINLNVVIDNEKGQTLITRNINFVDEIDYKVSLDNTNNIVINTLSKEKLTNIISLVEKQLDSEYVKVFSAEHLEPFTMVVEPIAALILYNSALDNMTNADLKEAEIEQFNSKFTVYEGNEKSVSEVNALLNTVFSHNNQEKNNETERYVKVTGDVTLEIDATYVDEILEGRGYYKIEYKTDESGLINEMIVTEDELNIVLENMSYTSTEAPSITKTVAVTPNDIKPAISDGDFIVDTGNQITGVLRTIGIVTIIILLFQ